MGGLLYILINHFVFHFTISVNGLELPIIRNVNDTIYLSHIFHHQTIHGGFRNIIPLTVYLPSGDSLILAPPKKHVKGNYNTVFTAVAFVFSRKDSILIRLKYQHNYSYYSKKVVNTVDTSVYLHLQKSGISNYYPKATRKKDPSTGLRYNSFEILCTKNDRILERRMKKHFNKRIEKWIFFTK